MTCRRSYVMTLTSIRSRGRWNIYSIAASSYILCYYYYYTVYIFLLLPTASMYGISRRRCTLPANYTTLYTIAAALLPLFFDVVLFIILSFTERSCCCCCYTRRDKTMSEEEEERRENFHSRQCADGSSRSSCTPRRFFL